MEADQDVLSQVKLKVETRLICFRRLLIILLEEHEEDDILYVYITKNQKQIRYIEFDAKCEYLNSHSLICYKTTIKKLFLYLIALSYPNIPKENMVVIANRILKRRTISDCAKLLNMTKEEYQRIEDGSHCNFCLKKVARMLNFRTEEFYYTFNTILERYDIEKDSKA